MGLVFAVIGIIALVIIISVANESYSKQTTNQTSNNQHVRFNGCAHPGWCRYTDMGTAGKAGYGDDYCYCMKKKEIVKRVTNCEDFISPGCNNDMCKYASHDHKNNTVYCSFYKRTVAPQESCRDFIQNLVAIDLLRKMINKVKKEKTE